MTGTEPVEIKITVDVGVDHAVDELCRGPATPGRLIWFLEDTTPGLESPLPLLTAGVILRLRSNEHGKDDSTVKLRPCRRSQLAEGWNQSWENGGLKFRIEQDWAGERRCLAASCVAKSRGGTVSEVVHDPTRYVEAFAERQLEFLAECSDLVMSLPGLTVLGPIRATTWEETVVEGAVAERWTVGTEDFLELSIRCDDPTTAKDQQAAFERAVRERVEPESSGRPKTRRVLECLATQHAL